MQHGKRSMLALLSAAFVTVSAGAAFSGGSTTGVVQLEDFDENTGELWGMPQGQPAAAVFQHTAQTQHIAIPVGVVFPPGPCRGLATAWNVHVALSDTQHPPSPNSFFALIKNLTRHECNAVIERDDSTAPPAILKMNPTP